jgi:transposase
VYYLDRAVALSEAGLPVSVINPKSFHHFAKLKLAHIKTDRADAALLAEYAERMQPTLWVAPDRTRLALRDIGRQINRLTGDAVRAKNRLHALVSTRLSLPLLIEDETAAIASLDRRVNQLTETVLSLIARCPALCAQLRHLDAAVAVAQSSAIALLAELCVLPTTMKANQVSRYAGLDVRLQQSGSSVNQPARLSKAGNAYLRGSLFMPAMSAVTHDPRVRAFYLSLQSRGKKKIQAICAVMRKYLTGFWACPQHDQPFDSAKLFSPIHLKLA